MQHLPFLESGPTPGGAGGIGCTLNRRQSSLLKNTNTLGAECLKCIGKIDSLMTCGHVDNLTAMTLQTWLMDIG